MSAEEEPKWCSKVECGGKGPGGGFCKGVSDPSPRSSMKDHGSWCARVRRNLFYLGLLLGTGAILCAFTTLNAVEYLGNPTSELLSTPVTTLSSRLPRPASTDADRTSLPRTDASEGQLPAFPVDLSTLSDVYHNMSDEELTWRAKGELSFPHRRSADVTPKVAFLFLSRGPMPLAPLWERYFRGHNANLFSVYLHAHPNFRPDFPPDSPFYRRIIPSKEVFWGRRTMYLSERRLLANALLDPANERFVHLSDTCIPITSFPVAYHYLMESKLSFVEVFEDSGRGGLGRYTRIRHPTKLKPEVSPTQWRKGSQWFEMSRALALMVVADTKYLPKFQTILCMDDCICYSEEHYLPTVLTILAASKLANRTTTYVDFGGLNTAHPKEFEPQEITAELLKDITTSGSNNCTYNGKVTKTCHLFARKFSPATIKPLMELAASSFGIP